MPCQAKAQPPLTIIEQSPGLMQAGLAATATLTLDARQPLLVLIRLYREN